MLIKECIHREPKENQQSNTNNLQEFGVGGGGKILLKYLLKLKTTIQINKLRRVTRPSLCPTNNQWTLPQLLSLSQWQSWGAIHSSTYKYHFLCLWLLGTSFNSAAFEVAHGIIKYSSRIISLYWGIMRTLTVMMSVDSYQIYWWYQGSSDAEAPEGLRIMSPLLW